MAKSTVTTASTTTASTQPLRMGVVGLGMGKAHVRAYQAYDKCEVVALCDLDEKRLAPTAAEYGIKQTFTDAEKLFRSGEVDAVSIATPNFVHHPLTMAALDAGLHVMCEKPLALSAAQAKDMVGTAKANDLKLALHFNHRMAPNVQAMANYAHSGDLGEVYFARTVWHRRRGIPGGAGGWFGDKARSGGGALIDLGVHILDIALYLMGYPKVTSVSGQAVQKLAKQFKPDTNMDVDDFATAYVRFENGATLALEVSWACHHDHPEQLLTSIYGTKGGMSRRVEYYQNPQIQLHKVEHDQLVTTTIDKFNENVPTAQSDFVDAILENREPVCSGTHGLVTMQILDAIYESSETGREVQIASV